MITLDFETEGIVGNPVLNPPKPVGLAFQDNGSSPTYVTNWEAMVAVYASSVESGEPLLFHNAPFDPRVAE